MKLLNIFAVFFSLFCSFNFGQDFTINHIKTDIERFPYIETRIQVRDNMVNPIGRLSANNFEVSIDGNLIGPLSIKSLQDSQEKINIVLCLDLSGSMKGDPLLKVKKSIIGFINKLSPKIKLSILGFSDSVEVIFDFTSEKDFMISQLQDITVRGNQTALYYGAFKGLDKLLSVNSNNRMLIIVGDGKNESLASSYTENDVISKAKNLGIPIYTIGYSKIEKTFLQAFERISQLTNGKYYFAKSEEDLNSNYENLLDDISNTYLINYSVDRSLGNGQEHILLFKITIANKSKSIDEKIITPVIKIDRPLWHYIVAGSILVILILATFLLVFRNRKKKEELRLKTLEEEEKQKKILEQKEEEIISEKEKIHELEKELLKSNIKKKSETIQTGNKRTEDINSKSPGLYNGDDRTMILPPSGSDRTVILQGNEKSSSIPVLSLIIETGIQKGQKFNIDKNGATIGKGSDNNIIINDKTVSSHHSKIYFNNGYYFLEDLQSTNGTYLNAKKIFKEKINHNDTFKFGKCEGILRIE